ncbi:glycosyltransferase family 2 protein [Roseivivax sp. CAU 1761]
MPDVTALTIAAGREAHLANVVRGLEAQRQKPRELIIGVMQEALYDALPATSFPVRQIRVTRPDGQLPLAAARNTVADAATGAVLAFIDVDCIPHPDYIADVAVAATPGRGIVMGEVAYLPAGAADGGLDYAAFEARAERHSDRRAPPKEGLLACEDYRCFWSLNFALHRDDWARSGKFDERYYGYGGEDTDFGRSISERGLGLWWMKGAKVYHQHHDHCMPPIHHLRSVLRNSEVFASKWGERTMGHWLHGFKMMGLIAEEDGALHICREPDEGDFALCRQRPEMAYANTRRVLDQLEADRVAQMSTKERGRELWHAEQALVRYVAE